MFSKFFIYRPVFALVISIVISLMGLLAIPVLPIENTPDITPPTVQVSTSYPGASAKIVAETVAVPIEQQVNGVEDMIYMSSKSANDGSMDLTVTFEVGTDIDMATVLVQNRVSQAEPTLPEETKRQGIITQKQSTAMVLIVNLLSPDNRYDEIYISNYINLNIKDQLARVPGVSKVAVFGAKDYGMRIWLDPSRLKSLDLTTNDVVAAIREQNVQVAAGQIGAPPAPAGVEFQYTVNTLGRLSDVAEFENLVVKVGDQGRLVRVGDVARVELGAQSYNWYVELNAAPSIGLGIYQLPGSNALDVAEGIYAQMEELATRFPEGLEYRVAYDQTRFITTSIAEVVNTLFIAILLVIATVWIFLQDWRTTLVPSVTIPVSLLGTFAVMLAMGMSINTLTLFGLVLVIGIVVDDAIVVVENTMRLIDDEKLSPKEATAKAMEEVTGPVVATTLVLLAVFVPTAMMGGITGRLYSQFAITISVATVFSSINALTLSPALCGMLLRPTPERRNFVFTAFERMLGASTRGYTRFVQALVRRAAFSLVAFAGIGAAMYVGFANVPGGFLPDEDQGYVMADVTLPEGASLERTREVLDRMTAIATSDPDVADVVMVGGYSFLNAVLSSNSGGAFIVLKPWDERPEPGQHAIAVAQRLTGKMLQDKEAIGFAFIPPPIQGLGQAGGFQMELQDRGNLGSQMLQSVADDLVFNGNADASLTRLNNSFRASVPQLFLEVDRTKAKRLGVPLGEIFGALQAYLGSAYVNDFNLFGRTYRVMIQADAQYRQALGDIARIEVRDQFGSMIPLDTLLTVRETIGPQAVTRYNLYPSATITGSPTPGKSSGEAIAAMERLSSQTLPPAMGFEWSGVTYQQLVSGNQAPIIFTLAAIFVYLFLAAQYESWFTPIAVMMSIPIALLGAIALTAARAYDNNVYTQIGLVLLIGLAGKTAILIVEFAKQLRDEGKSIDEAANTAARLRFRPVLMTAVSFLLGVIPLLIASGAGAGSRRALGTAVFGGMLLATVVGVILIPAFYAVVQRVVEGLFGAPATKAQRSSGIAAIALLVGVLALSGCAAVGPNYAPPPPDLPSGDPMPDAWQGAAVAGFSTGEAPLQTWWTTFGDPTLEDLIDRAAAANLDLQEAVARIAETRATIGVAAGLELPVVQTEAGYQIGETSAALTGVDAAVRGVGGVGVGAGWEIDVFGRIRRSIEAATARYEASIEDYRDVMVSLFAEVAASYIELRTAQARLAAAEANLASQRESLRIARARFDAGLVSQLDVEQATSNLADTEASLPPLRASMQLASNRLAVLIAQPPGALRAELDAAVSIPSPPPQIVVGLPAELLRQRPDIRRAERLLAAQTAQIGVATADLYPTFSLSGLLSYSVAGPGSGSGFSWSIIPGLNWTIFGGGGIRSQIDVEEARASQLLTHYESTVLRALEEVENSFVAYTQELDRQDKLREATAAAERSLALVNTQYLAGLTDFLAVLDTQRSLFRFQDQLVASEGKAVQNLIGLYRSLGGGWDPDAANAVPAGTSAAR